MIVVTADTITDEQIRDLELSIARAMVGVEQLGDLVKPGEWLRLHADLKTCETALAPPAHTVSKRFRVSRKDRMAARARCAEILNARAIGSAK